MLRSTVSFAARRWRRIAAEMTVVEAVRAAFLCARAPVALFARVGS